MTTLLRYVAVLLLGTTLVGCQSDDSDDPTPPTTFSEQLTADLATIDAYLADNNIAAERDSATGLRYVIDTLGDGDYPALTDRIAIGYEGRLLSDGTVFDSADSVSFRLNQLIVGWQIGLPLIREGGRITLYIPSGYAYGPNSSGPIPANANLIFDVELLRILR